MDLCAKLHKVKDLDPTALPAASVIQMATSGGAGVLGLGNKTGTLAEGKQADLILLDIRQPHLQPFYNPGLLVYAASGADVRTAVIGGKLVMQDRKILTFDVDEAIGQVNSMARKIHDHF